MGVGAGTAAAVTAEVAASEAVATTAVATSMGAAAEAGGAGLLATSAWAAPTAALTEASAGSALAPGMFSAMDTMAAQSVITDVGGLDTLSWGAAPAAMTESSGGWLSTLGNVMTSPYMKAASTIGSLGSGIMGAMGAQQSSAAQAAAAQYQARIAAMNQQIAIQNGVYAQQRGEFQAGLAGKQSAAQIGGIMAQQGANGLDVNSGSNVDVRSTAAQLGQLNALSIRENAARDAYGYNSSATSYGAQSGLDKAQAGYAEQAGGINTATSLIGGASSAANNWVKWNQN